MLVINKNGVNMLIVIYFLIAVGVSFVCSILEAVQLSITHSHINIVKKNNKKLASLMKKQKEEIQTSIAAILTLNTFAHTLGAAGVGAEAAKVFGAEYMFYISAVLTLLILVFSEVIPKTLGAYHWKKLSPMCTKTIRILILLTYPLVFVMNLMTDFLRKNKKDIITREEIAASANIALESGVLNDSENDVIENLLSLKDIKVKDIYTPRSVMFSIKKEELMESLKRNDKKLDFEKIREYSRIPIYTKNIDDIEGIIISKEFFFEYILQKKQNKEDLIKPVYKINENIPISKLLDLFLLKNEHLFIVTDSYGQTQGVVTLEDALETLLGIEIVDELDKNIDMREAAKIKMKLLRNSILVKNKSQ